MFPPPCLHCTARLCLCQLSETFNLTTVIRCKSSAFFGCKSCATNPALTTLRAMSLARTLQFESGAVLLYLADKYGPANTPEARGRAASWTLFANSTLAAALTEPGQKSMPDVRTSPHACLVSYELLIG
jgi:hypothetical protein